ncbi:MAG: hypothetical protein M0Q51_15450, partial [Bacteroidales bacterium]|nr:hypothetical protein [Bacteroidales bacterium]
GTCTLWKIYTHLSFALEILFVLLNFFNSFQQVCAACSCRAHTKRNCQPVLKNLVRPGGQISENE